MLIDWPVRPHDGRLVICGTGHRPDKLFPANTPDDVMYDPNRTLPAIDWLTEVLLELDGPLEIVSGLALGFDTILAGAAINLIDDHGRDVILTGAAPFVGQERKWGAESQAWYRFFVERIGQERMRYSTMDGKAAYRERNCWMVNRSDWVLACHDGIPYSVARGGTAHCVEYAEGRFKPIINIYDHIRREIALGLAS